MVARTCGDCLGVCCDTGFDNGRRPDGCNRIEVHLPEIPITPFLGQPPLAFDVPGAELGLALDAGRAAFEAALDARLQRLAATMGAAAHVVTSWFSHRGSCTGCRCPRPPAPSWPSSPPRAAHP